MSALYQPDERSGLNQPAFIGQLGHSEPPANGRAPTDYLQPYPSEPLYSTPSHVATPSIPAGWLAPVSAPSLTLPLSSDSPFVDSYSMTNSPMNATNCVSSVELTPIPSSFLRRAQPSSAPCAMSVSPSYGPAPATHLTLPPPVIDRKNRKNSTPSNASRSVSSLASRRATTAPDIRPYICNECHAAFKRRHHLTDHSLTHNGQKPFQCPNCPKRFRQRGTLTVHIRTHFNSERPFDCPRCGMTFNHKISLERHLTSQCFSSKTERSLGDTDLTTVTVLSSPSGSSRGRGRPKSKSPGPKRAPAPLVYALTEASGSFQPVSIANNNNTHTHHHLPSVPQLPLSAALPFMELRAPDHTNMPALEVASPHGSLGPLSSPVSASTRSPLYFDASLATGSLSATHTPRAATFATPRSLLTSRSARSHVTESSSSPLPSDYTCSSSVSLPSRSPETPRTCNFMLGPVPAMPINTIYTTEPKIEIPTLPSPPPELTASSPPASSSLSSSPDYGAPAPPFPSPPVAYPPLASHPFTMSAAAVPYSYPLIDLSDDPSICLTSAHHQFPIDPMVSHHPSHIGLESVPGDPYMYNHNRDDYVKLEHQQ